MVLKATGNRVKRLSVRFQVHMENSKVRGDNGWKAERKAPEFGGSFKLVNTSVNCSPVRRQAGRKRSRNIPSI